VDPVVVCPRCGRRAPAETASPFCPYCGRFLTATRWVAVPPSSARPAPAARTRRRYLGPPRYPHMPRWGFAPRPWRSALDDAEAERAAGSLFGRGRRPVRVLAGAVVPLLWATALLAATGAGAEIWRYALLLRSRQEALPAGTVYASDALVLSTGAVCLVVGLAAGVLLVTWSIRASHAAAERSGARPSRSDRSIVIGWLVPVVNLSVPGSVLAEIEHAALDRPVSERPRPSRLLLTWWVLWAGGVVLATITLLWGLRDGVQARADGVVLHAIVDLVAVATAVVTVRVVTLLTALLSPAPQSKRMRLVKVLPVGDSEVSRSPTAPAAPG
jgi:hypothetical protein